MDFTNLSINDFEKEFDKFLSNYTPNELVDMLIECSKPITEDTYEPIKNIISCHDFYSEPLLENVFVTDTSIIKIKEHMENNIKHEITLRKNTEIYSNNRDWGLAA